MTSSDASLWSLSSLKAIESRFSELESRYKGGIGMPILVSSTSAVDVISWECWWFYDSLTLIGLAETDCDEIFLFFSDFRGVE